MTLDDPPASPFRAGFGKVPPVLAGRDLVIDQFLKAVRVGEWGTERALLLRGFRGVGKTALLEFLRRRVEDSGWVTIDETASAGFAGRIIQKLRAAIAERDAGMGVRIKALGNPILGTVEVDYTDPTPVEPTIESLVDALASLVEPNGGILFTLDEVSEDTIDEFRIVSAALQRSISSDREIALIVAGLHSDIAAILRDGTSTFLRRAHTENLDLLDWESTLKAIADPVHEHGRAIGSEALDYAARASQGYPFLTQLVGDLAWKRSPSDIAISLEDVKAASQMSKRKMGALIHEPSLSKLSALERSVLAAMAIDDGATRVATLRERVGDISPQHLNNIRIKIIDAGLAYAPARGKLDFVLPYLRDYLREHTVTDAMSATSADIAAARAKFPPPPDDL
jgi:hypothetical protein